MEDWAHLAPALTAECEALNQAGGVAFDSAQALAPYHALGNGCMAPPCTAMAG